MVIDREVVLTRLRLGHMYLTLFFKKIFHVTQFYFLLRETYFFKIFCISCMYMYVILSVLMLPYTFEIAFDSVSNQHALLQCQ